MKTFYLKSLSVVAVFLFSICIILSCFIASAQPNDYRNNQISPKAGNGFPFDIIDSTHVTPAHPINTPVTPYTPSPPDPEPPHLGNNPTNSSGNSDLALTNSNGKSTGGDPSGVEINVLEATDLKIYPNPNSGRFTLQFNLNTEGEINVQLTDILGKKVLSRKEDGVSNNYIDQFDLSNNGKGIYILSIEQNNKQLMKKIIVN